MNISSKRFDVRQLNASLTSIRQRASGNTRYVATHAIPCSYELAMMTERRFDHVIREAFHLARSVN